MGPIREPTGIYIQKRTGQANDMRRTFPARVLAVMNEVRSLRSQVFPDIPRLRGREFRNNETSN